MLTIKYYDRRNDKLHEMPLPTDCIDVLIPSQDGQPALQVTVNTDAVQVRRSDDKLGWEDKLVSMHLFTDLIADADSE